MHVAILHRTRECNTHHFELHGGGWKKKRGAGEVPELSKRWHVFYPRRPFAGGAWKIQAPRPVVIRWHRIFRGSQRMEFSSNIMPHKPTGSISRLFMNKSQHRNLDVKGTFIYEKSVSQLTHRFWITDMKKNHGSNYEMCIMLLLKSHGKWRKFSLTWRYGYANKIINLTKRCRISWSHASNPINR